MLLAYEAVQADTGPHGLPLSETTSGDATANARAIGKYKYLYEARGPFQDHAAAAVGQAEAAYREAHPEKNMAGLFWLPERVERTPPVEGQSS